MSPCAWVHFFDRVAPPVRAAVSASLARSKLPHLPMPPEARGFGLMVTEAVDERVVDGVCAASRQASVIVLVVSPCRPSTPQLWNLLHAGAVDVVVWSAVPDHADVIRSRLERLATVEETAQCALVTRRLVGTSSASRHLARQVVEYALFSREPVLVTGESGTGKELIAQLIHELDPRADKRDLVTVDCTTLTPELSGSELFGHERGAFTGAMTARDGAFALAHGGTLFLDEIGELPTVLQAQLLRVVQEGKYKRVGGNAWQHTKFRLVSATNRDLEIEVREGRFRADLYYRIAGSVCHTPPLREHKEDVLALALHFQTAFEGADHGEGFDELVRQYLVARDYPGNVRELRRVVSRLCQRHAAGDPISIGAVPPNERPPDETPSLQRLRTRLEAVLREAIGMGFNLKEIGQAATECAIQIAIEQEQGNLHRAAARLGVTDRALQLRRAQSRQLH